MKKTIKYMLVVCVIASVVILSACTSKTSLKYFNESISDFKILNYSQEINISDDGKDVFKSSLKAIKKDDKYVVDKTTTTLSTDFDGSEFVEEESNETVDKIKKIEFDLLEEYFK